MDWKAAGGRVRRSCRNNNNNEKKKLIVACLLERQGGFSETVARRQHRRCSGAVVPVATRLQRLIPPGTIPRTDKFLQYCVGVRHCKWREWEGEGGILPREMWEILLAYGLYGWAITFEESETFGTVRYVSAPLPALSNSSRYAVA